MRVIQKQTFLQFFSGNSEASASELLEKLEECLKEVIPRD